jgi:hypothetical protein
MSSEHEESGRDEPTEPETDEAQFRRRKKETLIALGMVEPLAERLCAPREVDATTQSVLDGMRAQAGRG